MTRTAQPAVSAEPKRGLLRRLYRQHVASRPRLAQALLPSIIFFQFLGRHLRDFPRQLLTIDLVRFFICLPRYFLFYHLLRRRKFAADITSGVSRNTIMHNMRGTGELSAPRSHQLLRPIVTIDSVRRNIRSQKILTIGPRVEGEIYNIIGYGFRGRNVTALDLFSYSPLIDVGNMHAMDYPDAAFDVLISGWVLTYSEDMAGCAREMLRVVKPGGVIAIGNTYSPIDQSGITNILGYQIGVAEPASNLAAFERLFGVTPEDCYFRYDGARDGYHGAPMISVFRTPGG